MAQIHRGKYDPRSALRRTRLLLILCLPLACLTLVLTVLLGMQGWERLLALAESWRQSFLAWAAPPQARADFAAEGLAGLWSVVEGALNAAGWCLYGLTAALPWLLGLGLTALLIGLFRPALRQYRSLRARVRAVNAALKLLAPMPDVCHVFLHKRIVLDDTVTPTEMILVSPGGVVVMEVRSEAGLVEGCVTDPVLRRRRPDGEVEKLRNPARPALTGVNRLSDYLTTQGIQVHVIPAVLFVHPEASAYVSAPDPLTSGGRRTRISSCVITDATSFWEDLGRAMASGRLLSQALTDEIVSVIRKAPERIRRK